MTSTPRSAANAAGENKVVETGARLGYAASGLLHLLIAWLALQLAWGAASTEADQTGALRTLAGNPIGRFLLWAVVVGFVLLAVWQITEAVSRSDTKERAKSAGRFVLYAALAWTAYGVAQGGGSGGSGQGVTADLMGSTWGRILVGAVGLGIIGFGVYYVNKGWRRKFLRQLRGDVSPWIVKTGRFGYVAKGIALGVVGALLVAAAVGTNPDQPVGLDAALHTILGLPFGKFLLTLVALGFAAYGIYSFGRSKYAKV